jgi:DNA processing protein
MSDASTRDGQPVPALADAARMGTTTLSPANPAWPRALNDLPNPPALLRIRGVLPELRGAVAIVGTRYASDDALDFTHALARALAAQGRTVVSGGARGIDAAAHRGALEAGGSTVCVLPSGFSPPYPPEHATLFAAVSSRGALVSERPDGVPKGPLFLLRNRLIAALTEVTVVVQAPLRSGALSTAAHARALGRPVLAVPHPPWDPRGAGCLTLLRGSALICTSAADVLSVPAPGAVALAPAPPDDVRKAFDVEHLDDDSRAVWRALQRRAQHADNLAARLRLPIMSVHQALTQLLLLGLAVERAPGRYARLTPDSAR